MKHISEIVSDILRPSEEILWQLYQEATAEYHARPNRETRAIWQTTYKNWRKAFLNAA